MRKFVDTICPKYSLPDKGRLVESLLPQVETQVESKIRELITPDSRPCVTVDIWSNRQMRSYLGITGHLISKDFRMITFLIACNRFKGRHTASNISKHFDIAIGRFDLDKHIDFVITDNASNMLAAFKLPQYEESGGEDRGDGEEEEMGEEPDPKLYENLPSHERCFAHSLQLVIRHGLEATGSIGSILKKVSKIVNHVRRSCVCSELLENQPRLQTANDTRWNSQLGMVRSIAAADKKTLDSIPGLDSEAYLTVRERLQLQEFMEIMDAFEEATNRTQGENIVTSSYVIPTIIGLKKHLESRNWKHNSDLVANLKEEMVRLAPYERKEHFIFASFLDPRIKLRCFERSEQVDSRIFDAICSIELDSINASPPIASEIPETGSPSKRKKKHFFLHGRSTYDPN
jgi:hypothetical protein